MNLKIEKTVDTAVKFFYLLLLAGINICVLFFAADTKYPYKKKLLLNNISLWLAGGVILFGIMILAWVLLRKIKWKPGYCVFIGTVMLFVAQVYICKNIYFETGWDARVMVI